MSKSHNSLTVDLIINLSNYGQKLKIKFEHPDSRIRMHAVPSNLDSYDLVWSVGF